MEHLYDQPFSHQRVFQRGRANLYDAQQADMHCHGILTAMNEACLLWADPGLYQMRRFTASNGWMTSALTLALIEI